MATNTDTPKTTSPVWVVRAGRNGEDESTALERGIAIIGFRRLSDLSKVVNDEGKIAQMVEEDYGKTSHGASQLIRFLRRIKEDDIIVLPLKTRSRQIAIGRVLGPYNYRKIDGAYFHTRAVKWERTDISRNDIGQDLLYSLGSNLTVFRVKRNNAEKRFAAIIAGQPDPERSNNDDVDASTSEEPSLTDIAGEAENQILEHLRKRFREHDLTRLVGEILKAEGYSVLSSTGGPDGGADILAGRGAMGFDDPKICVQVKSSETATEDRALRDLQGTMQNFKANQGLFVSWGGFTKPAERLARQAYFSVRLWEAKDILSALYRIYEKLPEEIQTEIPMKRVWTLVSDSTET